MGQTGYKLYDLQAKHFIHSCDVISSERDCHDFNRTVSSTSDHIQVDCDDEIDPDFDRHAVEKEANHEVEKNALPVGATYEQNFMREVANLQGARLRTHHANLAEHIDEENANCFNTDIITEEIEYHSQQRSMIHRMEAMLKNGKKPMMPNMHHQSKQDM